jgi:hypothetical protein
VILIALVSQNHPHPDSLYPFRMFSVRLPCMKTG